MPLEMCCAVHAQAGVNTNRYPPGPLSAKREATLWPVLKLGRTLGLRPKLGRTLSSALTFGGFPTSGPAHGSLPPALLAEAREHSARAVAPLQSVRHLAQGGREGVRELVLISHVELVVRSYLGAQNLCPFLRCLAQETSWVWEETG